MRKCEAESKTKTAKMTAIIATKNRWGDLLEDEEPVPPSTTSGPDAKGIVTKVEYFRNEKGDLIKRTTKTRSVKIERRAYRAAAERRAGWTEIREMLLPSGRQTPSRLRHRKTFLSRD